MKNAPIVSSHGHGRLVSAGLAALVSFSQVACAASPQASAQDAAASKITGDAARTATNASKLPHFASFRDHVLSAMPTEGFLLVEYVQPGSDRPGKEHRVLIGYDIKTRAWFKIHDWEARAYGFDKEGRRISGYLNSESPSIVTEDQQPLPIDDGPVEAFLPFVFLRDLADRPEDFVSLAPKEGGGYQAEVMLTFGRRYGHRQNDDLSQKRPVFFETDANGRLVSMQAVTSKEPTTFSYSAASPAEVALPDPANGGAWRMLSCSLRKDLGAEVVSPEGIRGLAMARGYPNRTN